MSSKSKAINSAQTKDLLCRLGAGERIETLCRETGLSQEELLEWWQGESRSRIPNLAGERKAKVAANVEIERDRWSIPHIYAENDDDLFFGFGFAMAQDRLFQLDYLRRKASGRLAEILGQDGVANDLIARTVGLRRIASREWGKLPEETSLLLRAFSRGVNRWIEESMSNLPIEFALLDYEPEPWTPVDCLSIESEFRWYLTGRLHVIAIPELVKDMIGEGPLYESFLLGEFDEESILPPDSYPTKRTGSEAIVSLAGGGEESAGSNNWGVAGDRSTSGKPLVASDPHIAIEAVSCWYEAHLSGGSFNVAGMAYVGMPAILFGRNERVGWSITNNICSQRDLYREKTADDDPGSFLFDGNWEPASSREETIQVKDGSPIAKTIWESRNGPIVNDILPFAARTSDPISLKWVGALGGGWLTAVLAMDRAKSVDEFHAATECWYVPTFSLIFGDVDGHLAYRTAGRIPIREIAERGYRPGWLPEHQWEGVVPFDEMPQVTDPDRGWLASANNRVAPPDFPYPLNGTWSSGHRAQRIRTMIEEKERLSLDDFKSMQSDVLSLRAAECVPPLVKILQAHTDPLVAQAVQLLKGWDFRMEKDNAAGAIFDVFFSHWCGAVARERFNGQEAELIVMTIGGLANRLLTDDPHGWFSTEKREEAVEAAFLSALETLALRLGSDISTWTWGGIHRLRLRHVLSTRGDLSQLLDFGDHAVSGDMMTVCNTGNDATFGAASGAGYRLVQDLNASPPGLWAVDAQSQSGHPGSPHYTDQLDDWISGNYHYVSLDRSEASQATTTTITLRPNGN